MAVSRPSVLVLVCGGVFLSTMDSSMINVALPTLMKVHASSLALAEWVVLIYLLTITTTLLFWGQLSRHLGQAILYGRGLLLFAFGSLCCALAPSMLTLIGFRLIQALGASMMMAMGPALIRSTAPQGHLGKALGTVGIATSLGLMSGPVLSGILVHWFGWRWIFLVTTTAAGVILLLGRPVLQEMVQNQEGNRNSSVLRIDPLGGLLYCIAVTATVLVLSRITSCCADTGWLMPESVLLVACWIVLIVQQRHCASPLFPLHLFRSPLFAMAMLSAMLSFLVLFMVLLLMPFYLGSVRGLAPHQIGYVMMAVPACVFFVAPLAGRLHDVSGARLVASLGLACCLFSMLLLARLRVTSSLAAVVFPLALLGIGQAMFLAPNSASALAGVSAAESGITSSLLATCRNMGMLLGTALGGLVFSYTFSRLTGGMDIRDFHPHLAPVFMQALRRTFLVGAAISLLAVIASLLRGPEKTEAG